MTILNRALGKDYLGEHHHSTTTTMLNNTSIYELISFIYIWTFYLLFKIGKIQKLLVPTSISFESIKMREKITGLVFLGRKE